VLADQNFPKDAKIDWPLLRDASEDITDVQEDAWEEHARSVQDLNASTTSTNLNAEELLEEHAEESTNSEEPEEMFKLEAQMSLLLEKLISEETWEPIAEELQSEDVVTTKHAESE